METCEVCSASVSELRRGRCWGCYARWAETRPVGLGASCCMCTERRRGLLRSMELLGTWVPICHNCATRTLALDPLPQSIAAIRKILTRDRRGIPRRFGKQDTRVFVYNRRSGERRRARGSDELVSDDMIVEIDELASEMEALATELEAISDAFEAPELTKIRENPLRHAG